MNKLDHQRSKIPEVVQLQPVLPDGDEINGVMDKYEIDKTTPEDENLSVLPLGVKHKSWKEWKKRRPWLLCQQKRVFCKACKEMEGYNIIFAEGKDMREENAFISVGVIAPTAKKLLKKIDKHSKGKRHEACVENLNISNMNIAKKALNVQRSKFEINNEKKIKATEKIFNIAYFCAKEHIAFAKHPRLIQLHSLNGATMGSLLYSPVTCRMILMHIGKEMQKELISYIKKFNCYFSVMVDESTTLNVKSALILYVRFIYDGEATNYFLDLIEIENKTGQGIAESVLKALVDCGLSNDFIKSNLIGFASDGASAMTGCHAGAVQILQNILGFKLTSFHCMAHRLELAVHDIIKSMNTLSHFKMLCQEFHNIYACSSKRLVEAVANELSAEIFKIGKVFDIRWLMSSFNAVNALWKNLSPLQEHMSKLTNESTLNGREKSKYSGLHRKLQNWLVIAELALMVDSLQVLSQFSLHLQHRDTTILTVGDRIEATVLTLLSMKDKCGPKLKSIIESVRDGNIENNDKKVLLISTRSC